MSKDREAVPVATRRLLLVECGFKCSIPQCTAQWPTLQFHHINENPGDNDPVNLLVLCPTHHQMVTSRHIDRKSCDILKSLLQNLAGAQETKQSSDRNRALWAIASELYVDTRILGDSRFSASASKADVPVLYPRLLLSAAHRTLSSGIFIEKTDDHLFKLLYTWVEVGEAFNHRLDLTEFRSVLRDLPAERRAIFHDKLVGGAVLASTLAACTALLSHVVEGYGDSVGLTVDTVFFPEDDHAQRAD